MHTISNDRKEVGVGRRRRRKHSAEFKAQVVAACCAPGVSMAAVAMANGVNANLARRWVVDAERRDPGVVVTSARGTVASAFVPLQLSAVQAPALDIRLELRRGTTTINVSWPCAAASQCALWIREWLR